MPTLAPRPAPPAAGPGSWHADDFSVVAARLDVDVARGLSEAQVEHRLQLHGPNRLRARPGPSWWIRTFRQFQQPLVYLLLAAVVVTSYLEEWVDAAVIAGVVLVNAIVGVLQEAKAGRALEALSRLVTTFASVRRSGQRRRVDADCLVPGDVVLLEPGDRVPADLRLRQARGLRIDESALTGESVAAVKEPDTLQLDTVLADRTNLAFAGTIVTSGYGEGLVVETGERTATGRIATLIEQTVDLQTPLTRKIARFSRVLLWAVLALTVATFALGLLRGQSPVDMFMASVALAVGAIPEGLPAAVTIVLAIGVARMARRRAIVRQLPAVETLGSTTVICSDKTGTLTQNQMTVRELECGGEAFAVTGSGYRREGHVLRADCAVTAAEFPGLAELLRAGALCNEAVIHWSGDGKAEVQGDPTEAAMLVVAEKGGVSWEWARREAPRLDAIPFESEHMFRATLHATPTGRVIYKLGAAERLLDRCDRELALDGTERPLNHEAVRRRVAELAARGLRVLTAARRRVDPDHDRLTHDHVAGGLTFLGLQAMLDPPREEAITAVQSCQRAGIAVKMITGDHVITARAIADQIGLDGARGPDGALRAVSGRELEDVSESALPELAERTAVFARVAPEQKLRLVRALQSRGQIVAVTGDGVNDAPALKQADIGIAMGAGGTEVAKGAAAMVLTDDNFATIEAAVEEGRGVFDNLTKFIVWTLPTNAGEAGLLLVAIALGATLPALPVHLLWINTTTAILLGLMLVFEPKERGLMLRPPRDPQKPLLTLALGMRTGLVTSIMILGAYWLFLYEYRQAGETMAEARTAVVNVIVFVEAAYLFNCRSLRHRCLGPGFFANPWAFAGVAAMVFVQVLFTYTPAMNRWFHTAPLGLGSWVRIALVVLLVFAVVELEKWLRFRDGAVTRADD